MKTLKKLLTTKLVAIALIIGIPAIALAQITVNQGGTGQTSFTADQILYGVSSLRLGSEAAFTYDPDTNTLTVDAISLGSDTITPNNILSTGQTDEYCLTYELTGTTFEWQTCGAGGGDSVSIDGVGVTDPDFVSTGDIDFVDTSNTITANINAGSILNADINASAAIAYSKLNLAASLIETDLDADVAPIDGDYLQYDSTGTNFTWRDASEVRTDLGLVIGTNVQAYDADLTTYAGITPSANVQSFLGAADYSAMRTQLSLGSLALLSTITTSEITADTITHANIADSDQASTMCIYIEDPVDTDDLQSIWANKTANDFLLTELWAESDQTVNLDLQVDDGTPADVNGTDISPAAGEAEDTTLSGDTTVAAGEELDLAITSVSGTPTWVSICWTGNWVD